MGLRGYFWLIFLLTVWYSRSINFKCSWYCSSSTLISKETIYNIYFHPQEDQTLQIQAHWYNLSYLTDQVSTVLLGYYLLYALRASWSPISYTWKYWWPFGQWDICEGSITAAATFQVLSCCTFCHVWFSRYGYFGWPWTSFILCQIIATQFELCHRMLLVTWETPEKAL